MSNQLSSETSPYLLQHAENPVDWMPWGDEAFTRARRENKPVFLSVGYSTCHWCHVMAHESFEDVATAQVLNRHFVCIKLDREERPDIDRLYMAYVQALTGSGGWPMSVWLTPEGEPFYGGTYFPPDDRHGRVGFPRLLAAIAEAWQTRPDELRARASEALAALREESMPEPPGGDLLRLAQVAEVAAGGFAAAFDAGHGGFGGAPKFPRPSVFQFLFRAGSPGDGRREMGLETLRLMARGGMHDHLGGGFHRYSVDRFWHVPHFEKMLYDQAQIALACFEAWQLTADAGFRDTVTSTLDYVARDLAHPDGGFYSAEDADSLLAAGGNAHAEGAFYVWSYDEIRNALTPEAARWFCHHYGVRPEGNAPEGSDPHGEFLGKNILHAGGSLRDSARELGIDPGALADSLAESRGTLLAIRIRRPRPHRDEKVVTAWNGLAISAFALAGAAFGEERYVAAARSAARFVLTNLRAGDGGLLRSWCGRPGEACGVAEDYAFFAAGLLDLYTATGEWTWLETARELQSHLDARFAAPGGSGYFMSQEGDPLVQVRMMGDHDGAEPLADSVGARNLLRLASLTGDPHSRERAEALLDGRARHVERYPTAFPALLATAIDAQAVPAQAVIAGDRESPLAGDFRRRLLSVFRPGLAIIHADGGSGQALLGKSLPAVAAMTPGPRGPRVFLCENFACLAPLDHPSGLQDALQSGRH